MEQADLQDLVDHPKEDLGVETKAWLSLDDPISRANLARHIRALANHGGGFLLFGYSDDLTPQETPANIGLYNRDTFTSIVEKYLRPTFQCEVKQVAASEGSRRHVVVWVPGCGSFPVYSIADGPHDANHRPQGINTGVHYVRAPGPKSLPINKPELWAPLIRRCVSNDRQQLRQIIELALRGESSPAAPNLNILKEWHGQFADAVRSRSDPGYPWPVPYLDNHFEWTYAIYQTDGRRFSPQELLHLLLPINSEVRDLVWSG